MSIYKYVVAERVDILKNGRIRFSQSSALNDPIEMRPFFEVVAEDSFLRGEFEKTQAALWEDALRLTYDNRPPKYASLSFEEFKQMAERLAPNSEQMLRQSIDDTLELAKSDDLMALTRKQIFKEFDESIGVLSLTEKPDNLLMWAHYAQQHQGFVIEFDETNPYFDQKRRIDDEFNHLRKVHYSVDRPQRASLMDVSDEDMFLIKGKDWEYEQEWRMLRPLKDSDVKIPTPTGDVHLFSLPPECVKGIVLGARMSDKDTSEIVNLINNDPRYNHVNIYQASVDERRFQLNIEPI